MSFNNKVYTGIIENKMKLTKDNIFIPITYNDKPIGFILDINENKISFCLWNSKISVIKDSSNNITNIELNSYKDNWKDSIINLFYDKDEGELYE